MGSASGGVPCWGVAGVVVRVDGAVAAVRRGEVDLAIGLDYDDLPAARERVARAIQLDEKFTAAAQTDPVTLGWMVGSPPPPDKITVGADV